MFCADGKIPHAVIQRRPPPLVLTARTIERASVVRAWASAGRSNVFDFVNAAASAPSIERSP
jgi:hypothetical protein